MSIRSYDIPLSGLCFRHVWGPVVDDPDRPTDPTGRRRKSPLAISGFAISPAKDPSAGVEVVGAGPRTIGEMDTQALGPLSGVDRSLFDFGIYTHYESHHTKHIVDVCDHLLSSQNSGSKIITR